MSRSEAIDQMIVGVLLLVSSGLLWRLHMRTPGGPMHPDLEDRVVGTELQGFHRSNYRFSVVGVFLMLFGGLWLIGEGIYNLR